MDKNLTLVMKNAGKNVMNRIQMGIKYGWSKEFSYKEAVESFENVVEQMKEIIGDIRELSAEELMELGFAKWDDERNLYLIPLWAYDLIPDGTELECIDGEKAIKGENEIDLDVRFGCIPYGLNK